MYTEYKTMCQFAQYAKSRLVIWVLMIQKNVTNGQKHFFSNLFQFTRKILTCRANSANDIALNAKKNLQETYYQKVF